MDNDNLIKFPNDLSDYVDYKEIVAPEDINHNWHKQENGSKITPIPSEERVVSIGNEYDINKSLMKDASKITKQQLNKAKRELTIFFENHDYSMLLCNERKDYTVFIASKGDNNQAINDLLECCDNRGILLSIEKQEDGAFEIWLKIDDEPFVYYLFDYEFGIIEY